MLEKLWQNDIPVLRDFSWLNDVCTTNKSHKQSDRKPIERRTKKVYCEFLFSQTNWQSCACCISNSVITSQCKAISIEREKKEKEKKRKKENVRPQFDVSVLFLCYSMHWEPNKKKKIQSVVLYEIQTHAEFSFVFFFYRHLLLLLCISLRFLRNWRRKRWNHSHRFFFFGKSKSIISLASMRK